MAELGEFVGTILAGLAQARRIADEETAALAEYYKEEPLLQGMAIPRMRVPEVVIELPVLIESHEEAEASVSRDPSTIRDTLLAQLDHSFESAGIPLPTNFKSRFKANLDNLLRSRADPKVVGSRGPRAESFVRTVEEAYTQTVRGIETDYRKAVRSEDERLIRAELRDAAKRSALERVGKPPRLGVTIVTAEVKERADNNVVTRLRLVIKEEGVEWSTTAQADGSILRTLTPE